MLWAAKISAKIVLARLPFAYRLWQRLGLFRHGAMDESSYAVHVFDRHFKLYEPRARADFVALELGPGDSAASALIARCRGAGRIYLVDAGDFAVKDMSIYAALVDSLRQAGFDIPSDLRLNTFDEFLASCRATYLTQGLQSLKSIATSSIDFAWSQAVLEHVPLAQFPATMLELNRILKPDAVSSHRVDLKDHLAGALNNLRFSEKTWESDLFRNSGFYTNRIRYPLMLELFADAGLEARVIHVDRWARLPTPARRLAEPFRTMPEDVLRIRGFDVLLTRQDAREAVPA